jgi:hypothetical protein
MLPVNLSELASSHIQELIDSEVAENLTLEYKRELPTGQSEQKKEFLFDIAALANAAGGDIVYGIVDRKGDDKQSTGIADRVSGMRLSNVQTEAARLSQLIRDGIAPRLAGVAMQEVSHPEGDVLVIRVPRSWNKPHMVTIDGTNKFFGRTTVGKYPMSVEEIGRVFSEQGELTETIANWRSHRADLISRDAGPISLMSEVTMLFHVIPASAFARRDYRQAWRVSEQEPSRIHVPHGLNHYRYNADGYLGSAQVSNDFQAYGYTQLFRSGIVEYANSGCYFPVNSGKTMITGLNLEQEMVQCYQDAINRYRDQGVTESVYVGFSLVGIANKLFYSTRSSLAFNHPPILQNIFTSPEIFVDLNDIETVSFSNTLLPLVDTMWQITGRAGTPFKQSGEWNPFAEYP